MPIQYTVDRQPAASVACDLLAIGSFEGQLDEVREYLAVDEILKGALSKAVSEEDFKAREDDSLLVHTHGRGPAARVLLLGLGKRSDFDVPDTRRYGARVAREAAKRRSETLTVSLPPLDPSAFERAAQFLVEGIHLGVYRFERYLSDDKRKPARLAKVVIPSPETPIGALTITRAEIVGRAITFARDLVNEPASELTPRRLGEIARDLAKEGSLECKILGPRECEKLGMNLLLAVARGSEEEPRFIHLTYRPNGREQSRRRYALVGKGITFDSGGLSLKPGSSMVDMKLDMAGAATVLATLSAASSLGLRSEIHGIVAAAENMPSGRAYRLGDIYSGVGKKSVEITNTDAEGRLALADALAYAVALEPDEMIDFATLTGACMVALGPHMAGIMGNDLGFLERFLGASRRAGEEMWQLPLPKRLKDQLESKVADLKNAGDRWGGALTAGLFLKEFVGDTSWVHVDLAGPSMSEKEWGHIGTGGTGFGVASTLEYLRGRDNVPG